MTLHPQAQAMLEAMSAMEMPPLETLSAADLRQLMSMPMATSVEEVAMAEDRLLDGPSGELPVRIYTPEGEGPFPLIMFYHGGGFVIGDLNMHDPLCRILCKQIGAVVVSVDYGLAPEHKFPAGTEDCYSATCWAAENAQALNADANKLCVMGDSAGGCMAAVVSQLTQHRQGPAIAHQVLIYPVTDCQFDTSSYQKNAEGYFLSREMMEWFWGHYLNKPEDAAHPQASPLRAESLVGLPRATVITAGFDPLHDEGKAYADALRDAGVPVDYRCYEGMFHGFISFSDAMDDARDAIDYISRQLKQFL